MADNDKFRNGLTPGWRKPYDGAKDNASPDAFARLCRPALAKSFREEGCPGFEAGRELLRFWCVAPGELEFGGPDYSEVAARCDEIERSFGGTREAGRAEYVTRAVRELAFQAQTQGPLQGDAGVLLARRVCLEIVQGELLAHLDDTKVMETFVAKANHDLERAQKMLYAWREEALVALEPQIESIAQKLAADPTGASVTARAVRAPKQSTLEVLHHWPRLDCPNVDEVLCDVSEVSLL